MDETEQNILDAAMKVFASEGYKGATTRRIAQEANVSEVTLFRKFQSKENILRAVITRDRNCALQTLQTLVSQFLTEKDADLTSSLRSIGQYINKIARERVTRQRIDLAFLLIDEGRRNPEVAQILGSNLQMVITRLGEYFELQIKNGKMRNINPRSAALAFISYPHYTNLLRGVLGNDVLGDSEEDFEGFIDIFTKGIARARD